METIRLTGRDSRLSRLQIDLVRQKIQQQFPGLILEYVLRESLGDQLHDIPLQTVEGSDFFTGEFFGLLASGQADIAVHSLKDMSSEHFFGSNHFAVVDRDDPRDIAIFNPTVVQKSKKGETLLIGTCSPRREKMALGFLKEALPQASVPVKLETRPIRGNVETRLKKLDQGEYDGTILATAGLNRLLRSEQDSALVRGLLQGKLLMLLPLIECVPAPCQGAIVAEAHPSNHRAIAILEAINDPGLFSHCEAEKNLAARYGTGCDQRFGVTTIQNHSGTGRYASGYAADGRYFEDWDPLPAVKEEAVGFFSSTDHMKDFFEYEYGDEIPSFDSPVVYVANYKGIRDPLLCEELKRKTVLASGTKTWKELAKKGIWVTASADALGWEFLLPFVSMPVLDIDPKDILIITHEAAAERWRAKGYRSWSNYRLRPVHHPSLHKTIEEAGAIFWSSYAQYEHYGKAVSPGTRHYCAGGETALLLQQAGLEPQVFPTIKSFMTWRRSFTPSHSEG
jgi:hydroxymethylbilane synthase